MAGLPGKRILAVFVLAYVAGISIAFEFGLHGSHAHSSSRTSLQCLYCEPKTCNNATGTCERCLQGFYGEKCENTCPNSCQTCDKSTGVCQQCLEGWHGSDCSFQCPQCFTCDMKTGDCLSCPAKTWGKTCQFLCDESCHICNIENGECLHCAEGYYGNNCRRQCGHCRNGLCDRITGECQFGCNDGWYGETCEKQCSAKCMICEQTTGDCLMCHQHLWGTQCDYNCDTNCDFCNVTSGECIECMRGFYGKECSKTCGRCNEGLCQKETGYCEYDCIDGWFGGKCDQQCINNCTRCTAKDQCMVCEKGLAGNRCDITCPDICSSCAHDIISGEIICNECKGEHRNPQKNCSCSDKKCVRFGQGWQGQVCEECEPNSGWYLNQGTCCPCKNCVGGSSNCDNTGKCHQGCQPKYFPENEGCDKYCDIPHCTWCKSFFGYSKVCTGCESGYYTNADGCDPCSPYCKGGIEMCNNSTGICQNGCQPGWFGERCDSSCHKDFCEACDKENNVCLKCKTGHWGKSCLEKCTVRCKNCEKDTGVCLTCEDGLYGQECLKTCGNCLIGKCNLMSGECEVGCKEGWFGKKCDKQCMEGCSTCQSKDTCLQCLSNRTFVNGRCEDSCAQCIDGQCTNGLCHIGCIDGWFGDKCNQPCPPGCGKCDSSTSCSTCLPGFNWDGSRCVALCDNCLDNQCSLTGVCSLGCKEGSFGEKCLGICSKGCEECTDDSTCTKCASGFRFEKNACLWSCDFCLNGQCDGTGTCIMGCIKGRFGSKCEKSCPTGCIECYEKDTCFKCQEPYDLKNNVCVKSCSNCIDNLCDSSFECTIGCKRGFTGRKCLDACPSNCKICVPNTNSVPKCIQCETGFKIPEKKCSCSNTKCINFQTTLNVGECKQCQQGWYLHSGTCCPCVHCAGGNSFCNTSGVCTKGCKPGWYPNTSGCDMPCNIENCVSCEENKRSKGAICNKCKEGFYAKYGECKKCSLMCGGSRHLCDNSNGRCLQGCVAGRRGEFCEKRVSEKLPLVAVCKGHCLACNTQTKECDSCPKGRWGSRCNKICPSNCRSCDQMTGLCAKPTACSKYCNKDELDTSLPCDSITGVCLHGCLNGWHGDQCRYKCPINCYDATCNQQTGKCTKGCSQGWSGEKCHDAENLVALPSMGLVVGGVIAALVFVVIITISTCLVCKCIRDKKKESMRDNAHYIQHLQPTYATNYGMIMDSHM